MSVGGGLGGRRKLTRATTVTKTAETAKRQKEAAAKHRKLIKRRAQLAAARKDEMRPLTQVWPTTSSTCLFACFLLKDTPTS